MRLIETPEGVPLYFELASVGSRCLAFMLDFLVICAGVLAIVGVSAMVALLLRVGFGYWGAFAILAWFLCFNGYFVVAELRRGGATIGKRALDIRVISRDGGELRAESVFVRNLFRDLELYLPLKGILGSWALVPEEPWLGFLLALGWAAFFLLIPILSRDKRRIGDMLGGTLVVRTPKATLLTDMSSLEQRWTGKAVYSFTTEQLDVYGIYELQVLEEFLRGRASWERREEFEAIADRVKAKIGWDPGRWRTDNEQFLKDFYAAQRARLEHKLLFGQRQEFKRTGVRRLKRTGREAG
jgi:uncharacterized RDD family membrane protein YckC